MAVTIEQEPYKSLRNAIFAQSGLIDNLARDTADDPWAAFNEPPDSDDNFPKFIWTKPVVGHDPGVDIERHQKREDVLQFSLWLPDRELALDLQAAVDALEEYRLGGHLNSTHWRCAGLYKINGGWREIEWGQTVVEGVSLYQFTSDWQYKYNRRQNVA